MQQFTIPQFIDVEDKIIGPITTRQFIILLSGSLLMGIFYKIFDFSLFVTSSFFTLAISGTFAFAKINGRPFHLFLLNIIQTFKRPKLRTWNQNFYSAVDNKLEENKILEKNISVFREPSPTVSRLTELSLIVDTQGVYQGEEKGSNKNIEAA